MKKLFVSIFLMSCLSVSYCYAQNDGDEKKLDEDGEYVTNEYIYDKERDYDSYAALKNNRYAPESRPTNLKKYHTSSALITRSMKVMYPEQEQFLIEPMRGNKEGYRVSFSRENQDYISYFDEDGKWIQTEVTCIDKETLPKKVESRLSDMGVEESSISQVNYYQTHKSEIYEVQSGATEGQQEGNYYYDEDGTYYYYDESQEAQKGDDYVMTDIGRKLKEKAPKHKKIRIG